MSSPTTEGAVCVSRMPDWGRRTETDDGRIEPNQAGGMEKATVEYLTNRIDDDDGEKWATVSIYRISSLKFFLEGYEYFFTIPLLGNSIFQSRVLLTQSLI
jgi:hypothetical protein